MTDQFTLWRNERKNPTPEDQRAGRPYDPKLMGGYWRQVGARTLHDTPVMIWTEEDPAKNPSGATIFQRGTWVHNTVEHEAMWHQWSGKGWLHCVAVTREEYDTAQKTGRWPDGKKAREMTAAEDADIIPDTPASEGGNAAGPDITAQAAALVERIGDEDPFREQVVARIESALDKIQAVGKIDTMEKAETVAAAIETLRKVGPQGEARRKSEKAPWLNGASAVDAKWTALVAASNEIKVATEAIEAFKRSEKQRLEAVERERQRQERDRLAEENRKRLEAEAAEEARLAANRGEPEPEQPSADEIAAQAQQMAAEQVEETARPVEAPVVRTTYGKAVSARKKTVGKIVDYDAFVAAAKNQPAVREFFQTLADKLARAGTTLDGMTIDKS